MRREKRPRGEGKGRALRDVGELELLHGPGDERLHGEKSFDERGKRAVGFPAGESAKQRIHIWKLQRQ